MAALHHPTSRSSPESPQSADSSSGRSSATERKGSSSSTHSTPPTTPGSSPRVQLVPYARTASFDISLSEAERELVDKMATQFDALDLSSKDFDFDEIFTYDKPQRKLTKGVVEVSSPTRTQRDWSSFSFSHYSAAMNARNKVNHKVKPSIGEMYVKKKPHGSAY
ncbi:hypothetical protein G647_00088 [Cladophialophora carrionii CBS 160.54]|uniref:Uncharacterized protein n=1 Tax=Cladophialophora carrionii CBS 160.54 TaxID=1279043 RepID=V9DL41_9EURO|nr:uncharacterized protein G647_00088 [Cladophialophora carrionii CBS 160.54]ETI27639.1 hypothetical protein G647_00088 [Cladophialophora carrionii CBS 160.54]